MLKVKVIGIGAAGNRAAIRLIESNIIPRKDIMLLNSTKKDVPSKYVDDFYYEFGDVKGCGKERQLAHEMMVHALHTNQIPMDEFIDGDEKFYVIVSSTEGGTGSGSSVLLGEYLQELTDAPVHMVALTGFEDDVRGLKNTVDWFNSLNDKFVVHAISNNKCLKFTDGNHKKAEDYANEVFVQRIAALTGKYINPSEHNMDDTDLFKLSAIPGYLSVEMINLERIKSKDQFNESVKQMLENSVSFSTVPSVQRLGVIVTASNKSLDIIGNDYKLIKDHFGFPTELYTHLQESDGMDDNITVIASGLKLPMDDIKAIYTRFKKQMEKIDLERDNFFDSANRFDTNLGRGFDLGRSAGKPFKKNTEEARKSKSSFFAKFGLKSNKEESTETVAKTEIKIGAAKAVDEV